MLTHTHKDAHIRSTGNSSSSFLLYASEYTYRRIPLVLFDPSRGVVGPMQRRDDAHVEKEEYRGRDQCLS